VTGGRYFEMKLNGSRCITMKIIKILTAVISWVSNSPLIRFDILVAVNDEIMVFWDVTPCS
jgi:hypothetical protein